jgi:hypothetical protein
VPSLVIKQGAREPVDSGTEDSSTPPIVSVDFGKKSKLSAEQRQKILWEQKKKHRMKEKSVQAKVVADQVELKKRMEAVALHQRQHASAPLPVARVWDRSKFRNSEQQEDNVPPVPAALFHATSGDAFEDSGELSLKEASAAVAKAESIVITEEEAVPTLSEMNIKPVSRIRISRIQKTSAGQPQVLSTDAKHVEFASNAAGGIVIDKL